MAYNSAVTLDTIVIDIESNANKVNTGIDSLSQSLNKLREATKGGFNNLNKLATSLGGLQTNAKGLGRTVENLSKLDKVTTTLNKLSDIKAPSGLRQVIKRLNELSETSKTLYNTSLRLSSIDKIVEPLQSLTTIQNPRGLTAIVKNLKELDKFKNVDKIVAEMSKLSQIVKPLSMLATIPKPEGLHKAVSSLEKLPDIINKFDTTAFENLKRVSEELVAALQPLADKMRDISDGYSAFSKIQNTFGKSASTVTKYSSRLSGVLKGLGKGFVSVIKGVVRFSSSIVNAFGKSRQQMLDKFHSKTKQIFLSLLGTRTIFTMTRKAVSEYQNFDQTLLKFSRNIWRAFGAQLAPVIEYVMDLFKQFVRVIYSFILAVTGIDLIARANKRAMDSWAASTKDMLGNLQKFDDLNVVEFDKGNDDNELISMDKIDLTPIQKIVDWVKKMKAEIEAALDTGKWYNVGVVFAEGINDGISFVLNSFDKIKNKIREITTDFADGLNGVIETINWENVGKGFLAYLTILPNLMTDLINKIHWDSVGVGLNDALEGFDFSLYIRAKADTWVSFVKSLGEALSKVNWSLVGKRFGDAIHQGLLGFNRFINEINFKKVGEKLREVITNINWKRIADDIVKGLKSVLSGIGELLQGLFDVDIDADKLGKGAVAIGLIVGAFVLLKKVVSGFTSTKKSVDKTVKSFGTMFESFGKAAGTIAILGGLALVIKEIAGLLKVFGESNITTGDAIALIATSLGMLAVAFIGISLALQSMDWTAIAAGLVMLGGMAVVFMTFTSLLDSIASTGFSAGKTIGVLITVMGGLVALVTALTVAAIALASNPLALAGVALIAAGLGLIFENLSKTLPIILDACGEFINDIGPFIIQALELITKLIADVIESLGTHLPPIIRGVGNLFGTVFNGIANVINTVGNVIVRIMNTAATLVDSVLNSILRFIRELGPAINVFVDNAIVAITKLVNFVVSAVEYLINTAIVKPINKLIKTINNNAIAEKLGWSIGSLSKVSIDRFAPALSTGTNEIPYEGLYHLHPGEAVVPKKYNPALGGGTTEETNARLDTLIELMSNMNYNPNIYIGNKKVYDGQAKYNKYQQNKYGTINLY